MKVIYVFLLSMLVLSCEKDEATTNQSSITDNDVLGTWKVTYLEHADVSELSTYVFEFAPNNVLQITKGGNDTSGTWRIMEDSKSLKILIPEKTYPLRTMHSVWKVESASTEELHLSEMESELEYLETSQFTRL
ncbi:MAG: lipocalin-like domain-containing protein [Flavobacteriaceae bacterium]